MPTALTHPPMAVGVMGSASGTLDAGVVAGVRLLGAAITNAGCTLVTGACPGFPMEAVAGAKAEGGLVVGISPALSETEHVQRFNAAGRGLRRLDLHRLGLDGP